MLHVNGSIHHWCWLAWATLHVFRRHAGLSLLCWVVDTFERGGIASSVHHMHWIQQILWLLCSSRRVTCPEVTGSAGRICMLLLQEHCTWVSHTRPSPHLYMHLSPKVRILRPDLRGPDLLHAKLAGLLLSTATLQPNLPSLVKTTKDCSQHRSSLMSTAVGDCCEVHVALQEPCIWGNQT